MKPQIISLDSTQALYLRYFLKRTIEDGFPKNTECQDDYRLLHNLNLRFDKYYKNGKLTICRNTLFAIIFFLSYYLNENKSIWKARHYYTYFKLFHAVWFQSIIRSSTDPEDWKWMITYYYPDNNKYTHFRKW